MHAGNLGHDGRQVSPSAMEALRSHSWPGNVRELENVIHRLIVLAEGEVIGPEDLPLSFSSQASKGASLKECKARAIERFERTYIAELLQRHNGNVTHAAREAKKDRRALGRLIKKYRVALPGNNMAQDWDKL